MIFISDRNAYSSDQWQIVLAHEQQHSRLYHFIDLLLLQFLQIALWFHPLVYIYRRKMLLVHEYQADAASAADLKQYGQFLLEQTMLHTAPAFTHSFNYSPIKNRILMLTRKKTSRTFSARYLLFFPVLLLSLACSKGKAPGGGDIGKWKREGNKATNNGNVIEFSLPEKDSVATIDPATGKETQTTVFTRAPEPLKLNGSRIYDDPETPPVYSGDEKWETVLFNLVREDLDKLDDGKYTLLVSNMVVDKKGTLIYYETEGLGQLSGSDDDGKSKGKMDEELKQRVNDRINSFLNDLRFKPATINGVPAIVVISFAKWIKVSNHHATIIQ